VEQGEGGLRTPGQKRRITASQRLGEEPDFERLLQAAGEIALQHAQTRLDVQDEE
jgi:hypothetical protein